MRATQIFLLMCAAVFLTSKIYVTDASIFARIFRLQVIRLKSLGAHSNKRTEVLLTSVSFNRTWGTFASIMQEICDRPADSAKSNYGFVRQSFEGPNISAALDKIFANQDVRESEDLFVIANEMVAATNTYDLSLEIVSESQAIGFTAFAAYAIVSPLNITDMERRYHAKQCIENARKRYTGDELYSIMGVPQRSIDEMIIYQMSKITKGNTDDSIVAVIRYAIRQRQKFAAKRKNKFRDKSEFNREIARNINVIWILAASMESKLQQELLAVYAEKYDRIKTRHYLTRFEDIIYPVNLLRFMQSNGRGQYIQPVIDRIKEYVTDLNTNRTQFGSDYRAVLDAINPYLTEGRNLFNTLEANHREKLSSVLADIKDIYRPQARL